jgi:hypothetical protein
LHFFANKAPKGSFFKQDETPIDQYQRLQQSQMMSDMNEVHKAATHNYKEYEQYMAGEEGIDFVKEGPGERSALDFNPKKFEAEVKA